MMYEFNLWEELLEFGDDDDLFYCKTYLEGDKLAIKIRDEIMAIYNKKCSNLRDLDRELYSVIEEKLEEVAAYYFMKIQERGHYSVSIDEFEPYIRKYCFRSFELIKELKELYQQLSKSNNTKQMVSIYHDKETRKKVDTVIYVDAVQMHQAFIDFLEESETDFAVDYHLSSINDACQIYDNLYNRNVPEQYWKKACIEMLECWPIESLFYTLAIELLGDENGELKRLSEFVGIDIDIEEINTAEKIAATVLGDSKYEIDNILKENITYQIIKESLDKGLVYVLEESLLSLSNSWRKRTLIYSEKNEIKEKFNTAFKKYAYLNIDEKPIILHDSSLSKSGGSGFLITNKRIYADVMVKGKMSFSFDEIFSIEVNTWYLIINKDYSISIWSPDKKDIKIIHELIELYITIIPKLLDVPIEINKEELEDKNDNSFNINSDNLYNNLRSEELKKKVFYPNQSDKGDKKINNVLETYVELGEGEIIIMGYDDTVFGSAKDGFVLTNKGMYVKKIMQKTSRILYEDIDEVVLKGFSKSLYVNGREISLTQISERQSKEELVNLIKFVSQI